LLPGPGPDHPESLTADPPPQVKELLTAIENENFPQW
jgi:hypothetical protein